MKKFFMTIAAVLCCAMTTTVFTACGGDGDNSTTPEEHSGNTPAYVEMTFYMWGTQDMLDNLCHRFPLAKNGAKDCLFGFDIMWRHFAFKFFSCVFHMCSPKTFLPISAFRQKKAVSFIIPLFL